LALRLQLLGLAYSYCLLLPFRSMKITFDKINRRTHLYAAMFLLPWFSVYGLSSFLFNHPQFRQPAKGTSEWAVRFEHEYHLAPIPADADLRPIAAKVIRENGLPRGPYSVSRYGKGVFEIWQETFRTATRTNYFRETHRLVVEDSAFRWQNFLTRMH